MEGSGVRLTRNFSQPEVEELDPFLLPDYNIILALKCPIKYFYLRSTAQR